MHVCRYVYVYVYTRCCVQIEAPSCGPAPRGPEQLKGSSIRLVISGALEAPRRPSLVFAVEGRKLKT